MVKSKIDDTIDYSENDRTLDPKDAVAEVQVYNIKLNGKEKQIAIGEMQYDFLDKNIAYYNVYLIIDDNVDTKLGVLEVKLSDLDEDGKYDLENVLPFLEFGPEKSVDEQIDDLLMDENLAELFDKQTSIIEKPIMPIKQTKLLSDLIKSDRPQTKLMSNLISSSIWIKQFFNNINYNITINPGGGDCLFHAISGAYKTRPLNEQFSVAQLREKVADAATEEQYNTSVEIAKGVFDDASEMERVNEINVLDKKILEKTNEIEELTDKINEGDMSEEIFAKNDLFRSQKARYESNKTELNETASELSYLRILANLKSFDEFKEYLKSCNFWADEWAINILERALNIKIILLSSEKYRNIARAETPAEKEKAIANVLYCGGENIHLDSKSKFSPSHYVMVDHSGIHYELITYNKRGIFTFDELPTAVKNLIKFHCGSRKEGLYYLLEDIINYQLPANGGKKTRKKKTRKKKTIKKKTRKNDKLSKKKKNKSSRKI
jgi:HAMP domain-containing protein